MRRFETYTFREGTTPAQVDELVRVLLRSGTFIPEVLDSAVGRNRSDAGVDLVWEHAYESPEAYERYMRHPFHICILDRYLLPDAPECITASRRELGLGLFGYEIDGAPFRRTGGVRRVVAMKVDDAAGDRVRSFLASLAARPAEVPELRTSIVAANTMGLEWYPDGWTHVWEQAFDDDAAMARAVNGEAELFEAAPVLGRTTVDYRIESEAGA